MPGLIPSRAQTLRDTNRRLGRCLERLRRECGQRQVTSPREIASLLSELLGAGAWLRQKPIPAKGTDQEWDEELEAYRCNVEQLRELLPSIHSQLLAERTRIEIGRSRLRTAAEWARALRGTL